MHRSFCLGLNLESIFPTFRNSFVEGGGEEPQGRIQALVISQDVKSSQELARKIDHVTHANISPLNKSSLLMNPEEEGQPRIVHTRPDEVSLIREIFDREYSPIICRDSVLLEEDWRTWLDLFVKHTSPAGIHNIGRSYRRDEEERFFEIHDYYSSLSGFRILRDNSGRIPGGFYTNIIVSG